MAHSNYGAHCASRDNILVPNPSTLPFDIMPRSVQPGGLSCQMRVRYTAHCKLGLLTAVERLQYEEGLSLSRKEFLLVFFVRGIAGCDGCVCCLWVVRAPHTHKFNKILGNQGILGIAGKLLTRRAKLLHLIKANL
jgi:hypothetical protein